MFQLDNPVSKAELKNFSPTGLVPLLEDNGLLINDSLAIVEYINELMPNSLYPIAAKQRAISRSLCAEIHSGYMAVRQQMPFVSKGEVRAITPNLQAAADIRRIESIFSQAQGDFFWGQQESAVDAFYSVMAKRLSQYGITFTGPAGDYQHRLLRWPRLHDAIAQITLHAEASSSTV